MKKEIKRLSSGIPGFDELIGGGFVEGHGVLVTGSYGTGKSTLGMQYLVEGAKIGEAGLYITFEESVEQLRGEGESFGWDIEKLEADKKLRILHVVPQDVLNVIEAGFGQIGDVIKNMKVKRVVVDSILSFDLLGKDDFERRKYLLDFVAWFKKRGCTVLMTLDTEPGSELSPKMGIAESAADAIIVLYHPKEKNKRIRLLEILKMRETCHTDELVKFEITSSGFKVTGKPAEDEVCEI